MKKANKSRKVRQPARLSSGGDGDQFFWGELAAKVWPWFILAYVGLLAAEHWVGRVSDIVYLPGLHFIFGVLSAVAILSPHGRRRVASWPVWSVVAATRGSRRQVRSLVSSLVSLATGQALRHWRFLTYVLIMLLAFVPNSLGIMELLAISIGLAVLIWRPKQVRLLLLLSLGLMALTAAFSAFEWTAGTKAMAVACWDMLAVSLLVLALNKAAGNKKIFKKSLLTGLAADD